MMESLKNSIKGTGNKSTVTLADIVKLFNIIYKMHWKEGDKKSDFYCGIESESNGRAQAHNAHFLIQVKLKTPIQATKVEAALGKEGYDIGAAPGRGRGDDTDWVYMYRKDKDTVEHENVKK